MQLNPAAIPRKQGGEKAAAFVDGYDFASAGTKSFRDAENEVATS